MAQDTQPDPLWEDFVRCLVACHPVTREIIISMWGNPSQQRAGRADPNHTKTPKWYKILLENGDLNTYIDEAIQLAKHPWMTRAEESASVDVVSKTLETLAK